MYVCEDRCGQKRGLSSMYESLSNLAVEKKKHARGEHVSVAAFNEKQECSFKGGVIHWYIRVCIKIYIRRSSDSAQCREFIKLDCEKGKKRAKTLQSVNMCPWWREIKQGYQFKEGSIHIYVRVGSIFNLIYINKYTYI